MSNYHIDVDDFIRFLKESGAIVTDGDAGLVIDGKPADPAEALRAAFSTPIAVEERNSFSVPPLMASSFFQVDVSEAQMEYRVVDTLNLVA